MQELQIISQQTSSVEHRDLYDLNEERFFSKYTYRNYNLRQWMTQYFI